MNEVNTSKKEFIYLEKIDSGKDIGKWRLTYTKTTIDDIQKLESINIIREDNNI